MTTAPAITSHSDGYGTGSGTRTITTTSAIGDLLILIVAANAVAPTAAGWTAVKSAKVSGTLETSVYAQKATATNASFTFTVPSTVTDTHSIFVIPRAQWTGSLSDLIIGADGIRITNGTSTTNVAPSLTTLAANTAVFTISTERTTTSETGPSSISAGTQDYFVVQNGATGFETILVSHVNQVVAGASGNVTITYPQSQPNNGYAFQLAVPPGVSNVAPAAAFTHTESNLTTSVDGTTSADSDGTIASYAWDWGDGTLGGTGSVATHSYRDAGTFTVTLTVTDNLGATGTTTHAVTVVRPAALRIGATEASRLHVGSHEVVALYKGSTKLRQFSHTVSEQLADSHLYIPHRGFSNTYPEMTMYAYDQSFAWGMKAFEVSVNYSSDNVPFCIHDPTVQRVTGNAFTGNVSSFTSAQLDAMSVVGAVASENPGQAARPFLRLTDLLTKYAGRVVFWIEDKTYTHQAVLLALLATYTDGPQRFVWKQYGPSSIYAGVTAAGLKTWGYFFDADMVNFNAWQATYDFVGVDSASSDATLSSAVSTATGARTVGHNFSNGTQAARLLGFGMRGLMCASRITAPPNPVL